MAFYRTKFTVRSPKRNKNALILLSPAELPFASGATEHGIAYEIVAHQYVQLPGLSIVAQLECTPMALLPHVSSHMTLAAEKRAFNRDMNMRPARHSSPAQRYRYAGT